MQRTRAKDLAYVVGEIISSVEVLARFRVAAGVGRENSQETVTQAQAQGRTEPMGELATSYLAAWDQRVRCLTGTA